MEAKKLLNLFNRLLSKGRCLAPFVILLLTGSLAFGQVDLAQPVVKTIEKIAKEHVHKSISGYLTEKDPIVGIVSKDLIGQLINAKEKQEIIISCVNVSTTIIYLNNIKTYVEDLFNQYSEVLQEQLEKHNWTKEKFIAYSTLYIYFSERIKFKLPVSSFIRREHSEIVDVIESIKVSAEKRWVIALSYTIIKKRRADNNILVDVRALKLLQDYLIHQLFIPNLAFKNKKLAESLMKDYLEPRSKDLLFKIWKEDPRLENTIKIIVDRYLKYADKVANKVYFNEESNIDLKLTEKLIYPFTYLMNKTDSHILLQSKTTDELLTNLKIVLDNWLELFNQKSIYIFQILLDTKLQTSDRSLQEVSIQDHMGLKLISVGDSSCYFFVGGLINLALQGAFQDKDSITWPIGIAYEVNSNLVLSYAKLLSKLVPKDVVALGYRIPISMLEL